MNDDERKAYAVHQIADAISHVDFLGLFESYPEYAQDEEAELFDDDGRAVDDLIRSAKVVVSWPTEKTGWWADGAPEGWCPAFQYEGAGCFSLPIWFPTKEDCLGFIRERLVGAAELPEEQ